MIMFRNCLFTVLLSLILLGCQHSPNPKIVDDLSDITLADIAFESGDMRGAIRLYQKVLAKPIDSNNLLAKAHAEHSYFSLAQAYRSIKQSDLSLHYLAKMNKKNADYYRLQGLNYLDSARYPLAIAALGLALEQQSADPISLNGLGVAYSWSGKYQQSHDYLMKALALQPMQPEYKNNLALNYILRQQPKEAIRLLWPIVQRQQASDKIRNNLALALVLDDKEKSARQVLSKALNHMQVEQNILYFKRFSAASMRVCNKPKISPEDKATQAK